VCIDELEYLKDIEKLTKQKIKQIILNGFEVDPSIKAKPLSTRGQQRANKAQGNSRGRNGKSNNKSRNRDRHKETKKMKMVNLKTTLIEVEEIIDIEEENQSNN